MANTSTYNSNAKFIFLNVALSVLLVSFFLPSNLLSQQDRTPPTPFFNTLCDGRISSTSGVPNTAIVTDVANGNEPNSNLGNIDLLSGSFNYTLKLNDSTGLETGTISTSFRVTVDDLRFDAKAIIELSDVSGNSTAITIQYFANEIDLDIEAELDFGRFSKSDSPIIRTFTLTNVSQSKSIIVGDLDYLKVKTGSLFSIELITWDLQDPFDPGETREISIKLDPSLAVDGQREYFDSLGIGDEGCLFFFAFELKAELGKAEIEVTDLVDFGNVNISLDEVSKPAYIFNKSKDEELIINGFSNLTLPAVFRTDLDLLFGGNSIFSIQTEDTAWFNIFFDPQLGNFQDSITIVSNAGNDTENVINIKGEGVSAELEIGAGVDFGRVSIDQPLINFPTAPIPIQYVLTNNSGVEVTVNRIELNSEVNGEAFQFSNGKPLLEKSARDEIIMDTDIQPNDSLIMDIQFQPTLVGKHEITLTFVYDDINEVDVTFAGVGIAPKVLLVESIDFSNTLINDQNDISTQKLTIKNLDGSDGWNYSDTLIIRGIATTDMSSDITQFSSEGFRFDGNIFDTGDIILPPGEEINIDIEFLSQADRQHSASLELIGNASPIESTTTVALTGAARIEGFSFSKDSSLICINFTDTLIVQLENQGSDPITVNSIGFDDLGGMLRLINLKHLQAFDIEPKATELIEIEFVPGMELDRTLVSVIANMTNIKNEQIVEETEITLSTITIDIKNLSKTFIEDISSGLRFGDAVTYTVFIDKNESLESANIQAINVSLDTKQDFIIPLKNTLKVLPPFNSDFEIQVGSYNDIDLHKNFKHIIEFNIVSKNNVPLNGFGDFFSMDFLSVLPNHNPNDTIDNFPNYLDGVSITHTLTSDSDCGVFVIGNPKNTINVPLHSSCAINLRQVSFTGQTFGLLGSISPNPINANSSIYFSIAFEVRTKLEIYNSMGESVSVIVDERLKEGEYSLPIPIEQLSKGIYFYQIVAGPFSKVGKFIKD